MTMSRQAVIDQFRNNPEVSVLIIGAGVNGIGVFRELALQGVDVLIVDKADFCAGASAASSHMVHGGLRYLENGEFRLVREAVNERNRLLKNAPHAVKPLPTTIPIFSRFSGILNAPLKFLNLLDRPGERGALVIRIGLTLYDLFTGQQSQLPRHTFTSRTESLARYPKLNPTILYTATYYDAYMPCPERICIEMISDAEAALPQAQALNYTTLVNAARNTVTLRDELSGQQFDVKPTLVINAAGPWIDFVNRSLGQPTRFIGGTKGSHIVVDHPELHQALGNHEFYFENKDGRICLLLPFEDRVMIGSTDIRIDDPEEARCTEEEIDYMLKLVSIVFPTITVNRSHIVFRFAGVRPLPHNEGVSTTGQISRDHSIRVIEPGDRFAYPIYSLVGGKWTTFRAFSEQVTDRALAYLEKSRKTHTQDLAIGGGADYPHGEMETRRWLDTLSQSFDYPDEWLERLFARYGTRLETMLPFLTNGNDAPLQSCSEYTQREIRYLAANEKVTHLDDLILRRTLIGMRGITSWELLSELANLVGSELNWSEAQIAQEIATTIAILQDYNGLEFQESVRSKRDVG